MSINNCALDHVLNLGLLSTRMIPALSVEFTFLWGERESAATHGMNLSKWEAQIGMTPKVRYMGGKCLNKTLWRTEATSQDLKGQREPFKA